MSADEPTHEPAGDPKEGTPRDEPGLQEPPDGSAGSAARRRPAAGSGPAKRASTRGASTRGATTRGASTGRASTRGASTRGASSRGSTAKKAPTARRAPRTTSPAAGGEHDVLVVGAGPSGSSCAYWLADAGWDVVVVEKKRFPREKTCGDGLTPRAVRQLADMGVEDALAGSHRYGGLRSCGWGLTLELGWPAHPVFPSYGYTITRHDLDGLVAGRAEKAGATLLQHVEAIAPIPDATESGTGAPDRTPAPPHRASLPRCPGVVVKDLETGETGEVRARYIVVADGSNSRMGRALGAARQRGYPLGMALRGYYRSPRHDDAYIESHLDIRDDHGDPVPGYGWIFPLGDGRVNVGVGLLSTEQRWRGANTSKLMDAFVAQAPASWGLSPESCCGPPTGGKLPMSLAVGPRTGPNALVVGDASGAINPFNGEGIAYGYETGRLAAASISEALSGDGPAALARYEERLAEAYSDYYRVGRAFVRLVSNPTAMHWCVAIGMRSEVFMSELMRIMANLMRPDSPGAAEVGYDALVRIAEMLPEGLLSGAG